MLPHHDKDSREKGSATVEKDRAGFGDAERRGNGGSGDGATSGSWEGRGSMSARSKKRTTRAASRA